MSKNTSEGFPDPTEWLNEFLPELQARCEQYNDEQDKDQKRLILAGILTTVMTALHKLPPIKDEALMAPIKHLVTGLLSLDAGAKPLMFSPRKLETGSPKANLMWHQQKARAALCSQVLLDSGNKDADAFVANEINKLNWKYRENWSAKARTLAAWRGILIAPNELDGGFGEWVECNRLLAQWRAEDDWPLPLLQTADWAKRFMKSPSMQTFESPLKER